MARKINDGKLKSIYNKVEENPGKQAGFITRLLGPNRSEITRSLPALVEKRLYLTEDKKGGLWLFRKKH